MILAGCIKPNPARIVWIIFGTALLLYPLWSRRLKTAWALLALSIINVFGLALVYLPREPYSIYQIHPELAAAVLNTEIKGRYLVLAPDPGIDASLPFSAGISLKADSVDSLIRTPIWHYTQLAGLVFPHIFSWDNGKITAYLQTRFRQMDQITSDRLPILGLLNLRWVISRKPAPVFAQSPQYKTISDQPLHIYENIDPLPRAAFFTEIVRAPSDEQALQLIKDRAFDFRSTLMIDAQDAPNFESAQGNSRILSLKRPNPNRVELSFMAVSPGFLFLDENYFPGWKAFLDNKEARIWRADYTFRAVSAGPGQHTLVFSYQPLSFRIGLWASLATLGAWLCMGLELAFAGRRDSSSAPN